MSLFRKLLSLALAMLWLPAAQHCMLEAAEILAEQDSHAAHSSCCESSTGACDADACSVVESGNYKPSAEMLAVPAPMLAVLADLAREFAIVVPKTADGRTPPATYDRPSDFSPVWQFVRRAAQPPRAPSPLEA